MATEEDKRMAEYWKDDADGILIVVRRYRLFPRPHLHWLTSHRLDFSPLPEHR
jgi:hypothetical protein